MAAALVLLVGGCGDDGSSSASEGPTGATVGTLPPATIGADTTSTTAGPVAEPTAEPADDEAAVLAAVDCYSQTIMEAGEIPDAGHPGFSDCFSGSARQRSVDIIGSYERDGLRAVDETGLEFTVEQVHVDGDSASVELCLVDDGVLMEAATGAVVDDEVITIDFVLELEKTDRWRVAESVAGDELAGAVGCS